MKKKIFSFFSTLLVGLLFSFPKFSQAQSPPITRIDGVGAGNTFLEISDETVNKILDGTFNGEIKYEPDFGPIQVKVIDQNILMEGRYQLTLFSDDTLQSNIFFRLTHLPSGIEIVSDFSINDMPVQEVEEFGLEITAIQTLEPGELGLNNGAIGATLEYQNPNGIKWYQGVPDEEYGALNYVENNDPVDPNNNLSQMGDGFFIPYQLGRYKEFTDSNFISPIWVANASIVKSGDALAKLNNVNLVFTKNKSLWSRCLIIETANPHYPELGLVTEGGSKQFDNRKTESVSPLDENGNGQPDPDGDARLGLGWFPGYAIDVETGKRLNVYFGENSTYTLNQDQTVLDNLDIQAADFKDGKLTGHDMMWNPTDEKMVDAGDADGYPYQYYLGGQHFLYITYEDYDECEWHHGRLSASASLKKVKALKQVTWAGISMITEGNSLLSYKDGLIPNDLTVKLRVDNPYQVEIGTGDFDGLPTYEFDFGEPLAIENWNPLNQVSLVPNIQTSNSPIFIKNITQKVQISIFTSNGILINKFNDSSLSPELNIQPHLPTGIANGVYYVQIENEEGWMKNFKLIIQK